MGRCEQQVWQAVLQVTGSSRLLLISLVANTTRHWGGLKFWSAQLETWARQRARDGGWERGIEADGEGEGGEGGRERQFDWYLGGRTKRVLAWSKQDDKWARVWVWSEVGGLILVVVSVGSRRQCNSRVDDGRYARLPTHGAAIAQFECTT